MTIDDQKDLDEALGAVLGTAAGKRVLFWLLAQCGVYQDAFAGDAAATAYALGRQSVGRILIARMDRLDPRTYPRLLLEVADMRAVEEATRLREIDDDDME